MTIAREGYPFAAGGLLLAGGCWAGVWAGMGGTALVVSACVLSGLSVFVLWFFRNPEPTLPADPDMVVAPGQGRVIRIEEVDEPEFLEGPARKISIFLSVFDVHVQRAPVSGADSAEPKVSTPRNRPATVVLPPRSRMKNGTVGRS